jgi:predicted transcriptional regulator
MSQRALSPEQFGDHILKVLGEHADKGLVIDDLLQKTGLRYRQAQPHLEKLHEEGKVIKAGPEGAPHYWTAS